MIQKWYIVSCDLCGCTLNRYAKYKPTPTDLRNNWIKVVINKGNILTYCEDCYNDIKNKEK